MLDRFTDRARRVMSLAKEEALALSSSKVGTEHLLLALAKEEEGIAAEALRDLEITYDDILATMKEMATPFPPRRRIRPQSPRGSPHRRVRTPRPRASRSPRPSSR